MKSKLLIAIAALVVSTSASAGELDGSQYICKVWQGWGHPTMQIVWSPSFRDGRVNLSTIMPPRPGKEPELQVFTGEPGSEYSVAGDVVSFAYYFFNRKTLQIGQENKSPHSESYGEISWFMPCKEMASLDSANAAMEEELAEAKINATCRKEPTEQEEILCHQRLMPKEG